MKNIMVYFSRICVFLRAGLKTIFWWFYYCFKRHDFLSDWIFPDFKELLFNLTIKIFYKPLSMLHIKKIYKMSLSIFSVTLRNRSGKIYIPKRCFNQLSRVISEQYFSLSWDYPQYGEVRVRENDVLVECGAGEGLFSLKASQIAKKVYVVEPLPELRVCLEKTFKGKNNVDIIKYAVGDERKWVVIKEEGLDSKVVSKGEGLKVEMLPLDEILERESVTFMKLDVEGMELEALKGARRLIYVNKPKLAVASYHDEDNIWQIVELIRSIRNDYNVKLRGINYKNGFPRFIYAW